MHLRFLVACTLAGCGSPVVFEGQSTLPIISSPPTNEVAPSPPQARVEVRDNKIEIHEKIQFDYDKAVIKDASFSLMDEITNVIKKNPQIKKIRIEGHASSDGEPNHNRQLSNDRAHSVMKYLIDHGIPTGELAAIGYGADRPIGDNNTAEGREQNRRVEFTILEEDVTHEKVEIEADGKEKVIDEKHETVKGGSP